MDEALGRSAEHRVLLASSRLQALRILEKQKVHLVVLDLLSSGLDGAGLYHEIKHGRRPVEVLLLVAPSGMDGLETLFRQGNDSFLLDPVLPAELALRVRAAQAQTGGETAADSLLLEIQRLERRVKELEEANDELRRLSDLDPLTTLANRRGLFHRLDVEVDRAPASICPSVAS